MTDAPLLDRVRALCDEVVRAGAASEDVDAIRRRLDEPLRVAIAGRVKAGKSTLLNALIGEQLAPTDAGECTRVVTWYREGLGYDVSAILGDGSVRSLPFTREGGALRIGLDGLPLAQIERLDVAWPASSLRELTLIDTPGLGSFDEATSMRTRDFFSLDDPGARDADAVVYLMRHLHSADAEFLEAFGDDSVSNASPVNAIAVLSRADEIGAGRLDAMQSARMIATRYRDDDRVRQLCVAVLPIAGLAAEAATTLEEREVADLRALAAMPLEDLQTMLLSPDRFCDPAVGTVSPEARAALMDRLGVFGLRWCLTELREGRSATAADLARSLLAVSGIDDLRRLLREHFAGRAAGLKARSALAALRSLASSLAAAQPTISGSIAAGVERAEMAWPELADLRLSHLVLSEQARLTPDQREEALRVTRPGTIAVRVGIDADAPKEQIVTAIVAGVDRWRAAASSPLADPPTAETCELVARAYESLYVSLTGS